MPQPHSLPIPERYYLGVLLAAAQEAVLALPATTPRDVRDRLLGATFEASVRFDVCHCSFAGGKREPDCLTHGDQARAIRAAVEERCAEDPFNDAAERRVIGG